MGLVLALLVGGALACAVFALVTAAVGRWLGAWVIEVDLFYVRLFSFHAGAFPIRVGLIPLGSGVRFLHLETDPEDEPPAHQDLSRQAVPFEHLSLIRRLTIHLAGWFGVAVLAALILGPAEALRELGEGFRDPFLFLLTPGFAQQALASFDALAQSSFREAVALWMLKQTAFNLLPIPLYSGGQILLEILASIRRRPVRMPESLGIVSLVLLLGITFMVCRQLWIYLAR